MIRVIALVIALLGACKSTPQDTTIVFVCEHGAAKSIVAAALFNDAAARKGLPHRAVARGITPDPALAPAAVEGLATDGLAPLDPAPRAIAAPERAATRVVFLGDGKHDLGPRAETWTNIPPVGADYAASRDAIRTRVNELVASLAR